AARRAGAGAPRLVLAADTLVCVSDRGSETALGKPRDLAEARSMIALLSGRSHQVHTGLALLDRWSGRLETVRSDSTVHFAKMEAEEIEAYLDTGEWRGVAGAYRVQGAAALHIARIEGSWSGIVGLPIHELYVILRAADYRIRPRSPG
ncbi:MAG TPA: Maf family protein, partial [Rectinemataceae bacterium]|nr:Maf family protein [Rectinemataceae bacterium]